MPELPEVETIKRELEGSLLGRKIAKVYVHHSLVIREPSVEKFKKGIEGASIKHVLRKAKVLILELSNGKSLTVHLKMTGQLVYPGDGQKSRVSFRLSDGKSLDFNDQRLFGELRLLDDWRGLKFIQGLGPEPFDINLQQFKEMLAKKKTRIKPLLMDQAFISGIGNLYAAEALFRAKVLPERSAQTLSDKEQEALFKSIKDVLQEAIRFGGSSVDNYVRLSGKRGEYVSHHKVYDREGKPCLVCKAPVKRTALGGRGTYFCPKCQK
ncbi:MAG: bifunctional DNA-formamidopyrimidine glycosylase/DNA-(apurinic or apyrimidinic site) lyase [Candidatus Omnitrophica bacterium]|nr:bifunctional DNA-formamidopyrimidine glycosylase/DNA-(apurinic or apyrimidinic site) lyase [Candidatus Omnitrophota bacterium]